jgi:hypothetical protein
LGLVTWLSACQWINPIHEKKKHMFCAILKLKLVLLKTQSRHPLVFERATQDKAWHGRVSSGAEQ